MSIFYLSIIGTTIEKVGFKTIAIGRGKDKEELVRKLGARQYIDSKSQNPVEELVKLGGAKSLFTVPILTCNIDAISGWLWPWLSSSATLLLRH
jgi:D-arabinose 1-dehydrogenase-like Zn-dependent alcohol dehydrogenase